MQRSLNPQAAYKKELWKKLDQAWMKEGLPGFLWYQHSAFRYAMVVVLAIVIVATGSTGVYAYSSPTVTEGTVLYPVKQQLEQVEARLQKTPEKKAAFLLKQIDRREAEKKVLEIRHREIKKINEVISRTEEQLEKESIILSTTTPGNENLVGKVAARLKKREERLQKRVEQLEKKNDRLEERAVSTTPEVEDVATGTLRKKNQPIRERIQDRLRERGDN